MEYVGTICVSIELLKKSWASIREWFNYHKILDEKMQTLRRKMEALSSHEKDVDAVLRNAEFGKKPKSVVENWLKDVRHKTTEVQDVDRKAENRRYLSRAQFLRLLDKNIQEVTVLIEQGIFPEGYLIDVHDRRGDLLLTMPLVGQNTAQRNLEKIWKCLTNDDIISIGVYGMGGVGKTTIITHIYNRFLKNCSFTDHVYWVTVSQESSIHKLQNDIAKDINLDLLNEDDERKRAAKLFIALTGRKKFVLILDDMWKVFPLEEIGIPIGVPNGKLIVTTRSLEVCRGMMCQQIIKVEPLSAEEAWDLFMEKLGSDNVLDPKVEEIAKSIARECAGLPLAIVTTARSMAGVDDIHDWSSALDELREHVKGLIDMEGEVFKLLQFSYNRLKDEKLQQCFLYCALFPEDYKIRRVDLVVHWIAEGLIDEKRTRKAEYDRGHAILNKLENVCLLESAEDKGSTCVKMHDVIRDMALNITRETGHAVFMVKAGVQLLEITNERDWSENLERVSLMQNKIGQFSSSPKCPKLRTLLLQDSLFIKEIPNSFFVHMQSLQLLDLSYSENLKCLPDSISNLKSLRGLLLNGCKNLKHVPSLAELKELRELDLQRSGVIAVPEGLEGLVNLKRLDLLSAWRIRTIPTGLLPNLSRLQCLRLDECIQVDVQVEELISLRQLEMLGVHFSDLHKFNSYVNSQHRQRLTHYRLQIGNRPWFPRSLLSCRHVCVGGFNHCRGEGQDYGIVLPTNMQELMILDCHLPTSLSDLSPSLKNNASRDLERCRIDGCIGIDHLWSFTTTNTTSVPQNLKTLVLQSLPNLTSLFKYKGVGIERGPQPHPGSGNFFSLKFLSLTDCHNLKYLFMPLLVEHHLQNLQLICVYDCSEMEYIIRDNDEEGIINEENSTITFPKLQNLELKSLPKLNGICMGTKTMVCPSLQEMQVFDCPMLKRLPFARMHTDDDGQTSQTQPTHLKKISVEKEWWDLLEWDTPEAKSIFQPLFSVAEDPIFWIKRAFWWQDAKRYEEVWLRFWHGTLPVYQCRGHKPYP